MTNVPRSNLCAPLALLAFSIATTLFAGQAQANNLANCRSNIGAVDIVGAGDSGTSSGASISYCYLVASTSNPSTGLSYEFIKYNAEAAQSVRYSTVKRAKRACRKFKDKSSNRNVREAFNDAMSGLAQLFSGSSQAGNYTIPSSISNPAYSCNRSGRTNNFRVEYTQLENN